MQATLILQRAVSLGVGVARNGPGVVLARASEVERDGCLLYTSDAADEL